MKAAEILSKMEENFKRYSVFGIRRDNRTFAVGEELPCSQNMIDDLYNHETGEYPMLDGTCATGFGYLWFDGDDEDIDTVNKALDINTNNYGGYSHAYLIGGYDYEYGDDEAELVIKGAEIICEI